MLVNQILAETGHLPVQIAEIEDALGRAPAGSRPLRLEIRSQIDARLDLVAHRFLYFIIQGTRRSTHKVVYTLTISCYGIGIVRGLTKGGSFVSERNEEIACRYFSAGNDDDLDAWDQICDPNMVLNAGFGEPMRGLDAVKQFTATMHSAFSDFFLTVHELSSDGDQVVATWTTGGTQTNPLVSPMGVIPPTGRRASMDGKSTLLITNGKIMEERVEADVAGMLAQLGAAPSVGSPSD
jgi:predicted ester cyclase